MHTACSNKKKQTANNSKQQYREWNQWPRRTRKRIKLLQHRAFSIWQNGFDAWQCCPGLKGILISSDDIWSMHEIRALTSLHKIPQHNDIHSKQMNHRRREGEQQQQQQHTRAPEMGEKVKITHNTQNSFGCFGCSLIQKNGNRCSFFNRQWQKEIKLKIWNACEFCTFQNWKAMIFGDRSIALYRSYATSLFPPVEMPDCLSICLSVAFRVSGKSVNRFVWLKSSSCMLSNTNIHTHSVQMTIWMAKSKHTQRVQRTKKNQALLHTHTKRARAHTNHSTNISLTKFQALPPHLRMYIIHNYGIST